MIRLLISQADLRLCWLHIPLLEILCQGSNSIKLLTLYLIETPFNTFANRADPDQAAFVKDQGLHYGQDNFFLLCTNMKDYLYIIIHSRWNLA